MHGRSDQRFCNDHCRNTFNRAKRLAEKVEANENTPAIFKAITRNCELLKGFCPQPMEKDLFGLHDTQRLLAEGFNPKFFTSIYTDEKGVQWPCVFEMGFNMGEKNTWVRDYPD